jgi:hypothetical protein
MARTSNSILFLLSFLWCMVPIHHLGHSPCFPYHSDFVLKVEKLHDKDSRGVSWFLGPVGAGSRWALSMCRGSGALSSPNASGSHLQRNANESPFSTFSGRLTSIKLDLWWFSREFSFEVRSATCYSNFSVVVLTAVSSTMLMHSSASSKRRLECHV